MAEVLKRLTDMLARNGLALRGGFNIDEKESAPQTVDGQPVLSIVLVGNAGGAFWPHFQRWFEEGKCQSANPLDDWSRMVLEGAAQAVNARVILPNDRPFHPFQQWAMRAEGLRPSPIGVLMHPEYGLWHAYRGALLFNEFIEFGQSRVVAHVCDDCAAKPCLSSCPVAAHSPEGFAYQRCLDHVRSEKGQVCMSGGCLDRNACPAGSAYRYPAPVQQFFMRSFAR
ncbi:MAG: 4Fe-4S dicluster domain-containing protein [Rhizobiaceae bacterium]|nr:4Fe-4S dicluster domain-containing protein [Rhizobiaceae bacterium]